MVDSSPAPHSPVLELQGIGKTFHRAEVLKDIDLKVYPGEIVALVGDNGAGKSTLIKILAGLHRADSGKMYINGESVDFARYTIARARELGIETLFQESSLGEQQPLWRNIFAGRPLTGKFGFLRVAEAKRITMDILRHHIGLQGKLINADTCAQTLSGGERQGLSIGRAMYFDARIVILDEPTTALSLGEVDRVLAFIEQLAVSGKACIFISHNLSQVYRVAHRFILLDHGRCIASFNKTELSFAQFSDSVLQAQSHRATRP